MKKILEFSVDDEKYTLKSTNPNDTRDAFIIYKKEMQFDTNAFYQYVFSDINDIYEIVVVDKSDADDKAAKRVYVTISEIVNEVINKMNQKFLQQ